MFDIIETNKSFIYAIGDIHGEFKSIANSLPDPVVEGGWQLKTTIDSSNYT